jgi:hypothetical protein
MTTIIFLLKGKLKRKINLTKQQKKPKWIRNKLKKIIYHKLELNDEIKNKYLFYKKDNNN